MLVEQYKFSMVNDDGGYILECSVVHIALKAKLLVVGTLIVGVLVI